MSMVDVVRRLLIGGVLLRSGRNRRHYATVSASEDETQDARETEEHEDDRQGAANHDPRLLAPVDVGGTADERQRDLAVAGQEPGATGRATLVLHRDRGAATVARPRGGRRRIRRGAWQSLTLHLRLRRVRQ